MKSLRRLQSNARLRKRKKRNKLRRRKLKKETNRLDLRRSKMWLRQSSWRTQMIHMHQSSVTWRCADLNALQRIDSPKSTLQSKTSLSITMARRLGFADVFKTQEPRVRCASWLSVNHMPLLKLLCSLEKQSVRVCAHMQARFLVNQSLKSLQKLWSQPLQLLDVQYRWTCKFLKFGQWTSLCQCFLSNLRMPADKCLTRRQKMAQRPMRLKKKAKRKCLVFIKTRDWTTALSIWECPLTRQFSDFNPESANFTENSFCPKTSLKFTHLSWLEDPPKVVLMSSNLITLVNLLV